MKLQMKPFQSKMLTINRLLQEAYDRKRKDTPPSQNYSSRQTDLSGSILKSTTGASRQNTAFRITNRSTQSKQQSPTNLNQNQNHLNTLTATT